jgi:hypothetical protein
MVAPCRWPEHTVTVASGGTALAAAARRGDWTAPAQRVRVLQGPGILTQLGEEFDALALKCRAPVTARRLWLETWVRSYRDYQPVAVAISGEDHVLAAAALFGVRRRRLGTEVVALGHGPSDQSRVYATDAKAAGELAVAVRSWLGSLPRPWRMTLAQLPADDLGVRALRDALAHHAVLPALGSPMVIFQGDRSAGRYITSNYRGQAKNKWNRLVKHGLRPEIETLTSAEEIARALPRVMEIAGIREEVLTGRRRLDQPHNAGFFRHVILEHALRGEVELMLLRIGGEIGAYCLTFRDAASARMWSSHYHPTWSDYSPGHILSRALVERCVACPAIEVLDWMKGLEPYKLRTANHIEPAQSLRAWSGRGGRAVGVASECLRAALKGARARYPVLRRLQVGLRQRLGGIGARVAAGNGSHEE